MQYYFIMRVYQVLPISVKSYFWSRKHILFNSIFKLSCSLELGHHTADLKI